MKKSLFFVLLMITANELLAQVKPRRPFTQSDETIVPNPPANNTNPNNTITNQQSAPKDTIGFEHRDDAKDSINISYKFLDSVRKYTIDSSINDFDNYFSVPSSYLYLGNNGAAATSLIYTDKRKPGFDEGFHAYDIYKYTVEGTRYYRTTRPFSFINYQLASGKEQMLRAGHTQNPKPNLNWGFDYKIGRAHV